MDRAADLSRFYVLLGQLEKRVGRKRRLADCDGSMGWPPRGVYFFFEDGEARVGSSELRVVRVGTHAVRPSDHSSLWGRLRSHRGTLAGGHAGGGNHRGSVFRKHVGTAILTKEHLREQYPRWGKGASASKQVRDHEYPIEKLVSTHIRAMPFLWLRVDDRPGPDSIRSYFERNAIALLSNYGRANPPQAIDPPSSTWLGHHCEKKIVRESGLWNVQHVEERTCDADFLDKLEQYIEQM